MTGRDKSEGGSPDETRWLGGSRFAALLGGLLLITFFPVLFGGQAFFHRDYGFLGYPFALFNQQALLGGSIPHWNPLIHCGVPHFAQWNTMVLYPGSLIYVLFPLPWSLAWFCVLHLLLGGIGMHRLGRKLTGSDFAAAFGGIAFPFGGLILGCVIYPNYLVAFGWMPWLYLLLRVAWREGGRHLILAALVGTMQMLSGAPELILLTWVMLGVVLLADVGRGRQALRPLGRFLAVVSLVAGLSAFQLLPFFKLLGVSQRSAATGTELWSLPWWGWLNAVFPLFGSFKTMQGVFVQAGQAFLPSVYLGCPAVVLGVLGVMRSRDRGRVMEALFVLFCVLLAFGSWFFLHRIVTSVIPIGFARFPVKAILPVAFLVPFLAMFGVAALEHQSAGESRRALKIWGAVVAGLILVGIVLMFTGMNIPMEPRAMTGNGIVRIVLLVIALALLFRRGRVIGVQRTLATLGMLLVVWVDGITHTPVLNPTIPAASFQPGAIRAHHESSLGPLPNPGQGRVMLSPFAERELFTRMVPEFEADFVGQRLALWGNLNLLDAVPKVNGAATLLTAEARDIEVALYAGTAATNRALMDFLGVRHVTQTNEILQWVGRTNALPLVTAGQAVVGADLDPTDAAWNPRLVVYRIGDAKAAVPEATVSEVRYAAGEIEFKVRTEQPTVAVIAESWDPSWIAEVNGQKTAVEKANHGFMLVELPAGESGIRLAFEDASFQRGAMVTLLTLGLGLGYWLRDRWKAAGKN